jgi:hypothetical protein
MVHQSRFSTDRSLRSTGHTVFAHAFHRVYACECDHLVDLGLQVRTSGFEFEDDQGTD